MAFCTNGSMADHLNEPAIEVMYIPLNGYHISMASCTNGSMADHLNEPAIEVMHLPLNGLI